MFWFHFGWLSINLFAAHHNKLHYMRWWDCYTTQNNTAIGYSELWLQQHATLYGRLLWILTNNVIYYGYPNKITKQRMLLREEVGPSIPWTWPSKFKSYLLYSMKDNWLLGTQPLASAPVQNRPQDPKHYGMLTGYSWSNLHTRGSCTKDAKLMETCRGLYQDPRVEGVWPATISWWHQLIANIFQKFHSRHKKFNNFVLLH